MAKFQEYKQQDDFCGADLARKYVQMGFTRSRRYAARSGGRKRDKQGRAIPKLDRKDEDPAKAESAALFKAALDNMKQDEWYTRKTQEWKERAALS